MTGRVVKMWFDREDWEWRPVDNGIPQGSPVSPVLFTLYITDLLKSLKRTAGEKGMRVYFPMFIDNDSLVISVETWEEGRRWSRELFQEMGECAREKKMGCEEARFSWTRIGRKKD